MMHSLENAEQTLLVHSSPLLILILRQINEVYSTSSKFLQAPLQDYPTSHLCLVLPSSFLP